MQSVGVGLELSVLVVPGSPADRAGLRLGDRIVRVDGQDVSRMGADKLVGLTRGPAGAVVRVAVMREGREVVLELTRESPGRSVQHEAMSAAQRLKRLAQYELDEERAIVAAIDRDAPRDKRLVARELFIAPPLADTADVEFHQLTIAPEVLAAVGAQEFKLCNPSICWHEGRLRACVRTLNYWITPAGYVIREADRGVIRTQNFLGWIDPRTWELGDVTPMRDFATRAGRYDHTGVLGYEDVRLFSIGGRLGGSATICDGTPNARPNEQRQIVVLELSDRGNVVEARIQHTSRKHEKNWMPVGGLDSIAWVYQCDPTVVRIYDDATGTNVEMKRSSPRWALEHVRGGTQLVPVPGDGFVAAVHEVQYYTGVYTYVHRFVLFDDELRIVGVSRPWHFREKGIEFCAGMVRTPGSYVLSFGVRDCEAWIARVDAEDVHRMVGL